MVWGYDPTDSSNPIPQSALLANVVKNPSNSRELTIYVNDYPTVDYVKFYYRYQTIEYIFRPPDMLIPRIIWSGLNYIGTDYYPSATDGYRYKLTFSLPSCTDYQVFVKAYDTQGHFIGLDSV